ncbi:ATP-binding cassette domain-containing protein [Lewinella sp. IMCC34183]|uniref:ABC transporter ATP-binding protein n=1 Tax=Lewinella sp. IMCC34183 TaxID=2248762 RepID=UPI000E22A36B|nr:ATP-binding cassette domain-containing protein [Lewinella sp. IMCC34183]
MAADLPPLQIRFRDVSKRFGRQYILRQRTEEFLAGECYGVRGSNGSGKSTLLRLLSGQLSPTRGRVEYRFGERTVPVENMFRYVSWTGPYFELVEELTVQEFLTFHYTLKPLMAGLSVDAVVDRIGLRAAAKRPLTDCSSGMRQRVLLATALYAATPLLLLDEPTVTLDDASAEWFAGELRSCRAGRLTVVASNDERDLRECTQFTQL